MVIRSSADGGRLWSPPRPVNADAEAVAADGDSRPKIAAGPAGELYVSWTKPLSKPFTGEVRLSRSLDGGKRFSAPLTVHADRQEITHRFDALTVSRDGKPVVAWIDKRDIETAKAAGQPYRGAAVYFAVSDDRGASFRGDYRLGEHSCECCRIALLPRDDGSVTAFWRHVFPPNVRDHALARLYTDGRSEPLQRATFDDWHTDACPHHGPSLAVDAAGQLHAVWFSQGGLAGVHYGRLVDGRVDGMRRIGGGGAAHADIAASGKRVAIAWKEFDGSATRLLAELSEDSGQTWRPLTLSYDPGPFRPATRTRTRGQIPRLLEHGGSAVCNGGAAMIRALRTIAIASSVLALRRSRCGGRTAALSGRQPGRDPGGEGGAAAGRILLVHHLRALPQGTRRTGCLEEAPPGG